MGLTPATICEYLETFAVAHVILFEAAHQSGATEGA
jgi:hypothetical protein